MALKRQSSPSGSWSSSSGDSDGLTRSGSVDELSHKAGFLDAGEAIAISSDEETRQKEKITESGDGSNSRSSSSTSVAEIRDQPRGGEESEIEVLGGEYSGKKKASASVENRGEEKKEGKWKWKGKEKINENKRKRRRNNTNLANVMPVAWRTRSFEKPKKRVNYTSFYEIAGSDSDSSSDSEGSGECEEEESKSEHKNVPILERVKTMRNQNTKVEKGKGINMLLSSSSDDEDETVRKVEKGKEVTKEKSVRISKRVKRRCQKMMDEDLFDFLIGGLDAQHQESRNLPRELPLVFDFETDEEPPVEKSEFEELADEAWQDYDFALGMEDLGSHKPDEDMARRDAVYIATGIYCPNGEHEMYLDEQIGYLCRNCCYVETEIRDILPAFAKGLKKAPAGKNRMYENDILKYAKLYEKTEVQDKPESSFQTTGTVWDLIPGLIETMYPHQKEAFEFMWKNLAGCTRLDELHSIAARSDKLGGCVISHEPGTGKTRLAIVFIQSYMRAFPKSHPVVIAPASLMHNWNTEFKKWGFDLPFHDMNSKDFTGKEDETILDKASRLPHSKDLVREVKLGSWAKGNSVLGISYSLFNKYISALKKGTTNYISDQSYAKPKEREMLLKKPDLLILDEGHIPRNDSSLLWKAFSEVKTENRIILSGTPFQNSFPELFNTLRLVRPTFAEKLNVSTEKPEKKENLLHKKKQKATKDIWTRPTRNVTDADVAEVRLVLKPFVHVYNGEILKSLPGLRESVIILKPEPIQSETIKQMVKSSNQLDREYKTSLSSIHPYLLTSITTLTERETSSLDMDRLKNLRHDPYAGVKTKFVVEFIRLLNCGALKERALIFSQYIEPLKLIMEQLTCIFQWTEGTEVLQIHGKIPRNERQRSITAFNDKNSGARVLVASTKACSEGIDLTGASRVILLDVVWNPSVGKQALSRAFRIGQEKVVYTYNLITDGKAEMEKYAVQMQKEKVSKLVFCPDGEASAGIQIGHPDVRKLVAEDRVLEAITSNEKLKGMFVKTHPTNSDHWRYEMDA